MAWMGSTTIVVSGGPLKAAKSLVKWYSCRSRRAWSWADWIWYLSARRITAEKASKEVG